MSESTAEAFDYYLSTCGPAPDCALYAVAGRYGQAAPDFPWVRDRFKDIVRVLCVGRGPGPRNALVEGLCWNQGIRWVRPFRGMRRVERQQTLFGARPQEVVSENENTGKDDHHV